MFVKKRLVNIAAQGGSRKNRVILGLMTFGPDTSRGARITSVDELNKHLDYFQEQGYSEVDTARTYVGGKQEAYTAEANWQSRGLKLATKWYPIFAGAHKAQEVKKRFNQSLENLKTDKVDIFYLHAADRTVPFAETLQAVDELHREGKFDTFGISNLTAFEVSEVMMTCIMNNWVRPTLYQGVYNAIARMIEPELLVALRRYGLDIVVYNPLAGGILSGKYKTAEIPEEGRYSNTASDMGKRYRERYFRDSTFEALRVIEPIVAKHNLTLIETALRWCVHHSELRLANKGGNDGIIIGVSNFEQLKGNLADLEKGPLPEEVVKALDEAWLVNKANAPPYWHGELKYEYDTERAVLQESKM